jgi:TolB-like protein
MQQTGDLYANHRLAGVHDRVFADGIVDHIITALTRTRWLLAALLFRRSEGGSVLSQGTKNVDKKTRPHIYVTDG